ncbi:MAG TPA: phosphomannomutase/phosphoglucomutase [Candidatus Nanoarchaeia archaeon]|nr:phosphomannomutase/phosphoglucomutase [Candidatus Nanoarchaeia archaeon]
MPLFKAYDVRGKYPGEFNEKAAYAIARAFVLHLRPKTMLLARDMRNSSPQIHQAVVRGLLEQGANVLDIGLASSDLFYFASYHLRADAGIMITASHNPGEYNGMKFVREKAIPITEDNGMRQIQQLAEQGKFPPAKPGKIREKKGMLRQYAAATLQQADRKMAKGKRVVLDAGNGMACLVAEEMFRKAGLEIIRMNFLLDGNFPGRGPNPLLNHGDIQKRVVQERADLGIAWDGDTDRVFFVDEQGDFIPGDFITGLLAKQMLAKSPGGRVVYDIRASRYVPDSIAAAGGVPLPSRVGHSFIKQLMRKEKAIFGGEVSGHYYYRYQDLYAENGYLPAFQILEMMAKEGKPLSALLADTHAYHISGEINFTVQDKEHVLRLLEMKYADARKAKIDGLSLDYDDWRCNVRASNTEPLLRLNLEAKSAQLLQEKVQEITKAITGA